MSEAKIEVKVGAVSFSGEGEGKWLSEQLDKILDKVPQLVAIAPDLGSKDGGSANGQGSPKNSKKAAGNLSVYLKSKDATTKQVKKFLATAAWLHDTTNRDRLTTGD